MAKVTTSHYVIFEYWKDKVICENGNISSDISDKGVEVITDWGEPCCWACGKPIIGDYEKNRNREEKFDFKKLWNDIDVKSKLNRCHIVPGALGGEDVPENLFLLCEDCHEKSPDTMKANSFFRWVYDMRKTHCFGIESPGVMFEKLKNGLSRRGLDSILTSEWRPQMTSEEIKQSLSEYMQQHTCTHWSKYSEQTRIDGFVDWLVHIYLNSCLEQSEHESILK